MNHVFIDLQNYPIHLNTFPQNYPYKPNFRKKTYLTLESVQFGCLRTKEATTGQNNFCLVFLAWLTVPH